MSRTGIGVVFTGAGTPLEPRRFDVPDPGPGEVLVRVTGCTLCGSDLHTVEGRRSAPVPSVLGHEILGRVEAIGGGTPGVRVGDRVTWSVVANCGDCFFCRRGLPQKCERMVKYGHEPLRPGRELTGGLAEYCLLAKGTAIVPIPDHLPDEVACPANCATATVAAALRAASGIAETPDRRPTLPEVTVLVQGAGMLGLTACAMARAAGAAEVICCDPAAGRLARAAEFGATRLAVPGELAGAVRSVTAGYGVDVAVELSGSPAAFAAGMTSLRTGGTYVLVGAVFPSPPVAFEMEALVRRQLTVRGVHNYAPEDLAAAVRFLAGAGAYPFASLVSSWVPLADAGRAFDLARDPAAFRVGVRSTN